jgi:hypothetical protein
MVARKIQALVQPGGKKPTREAHIRTVVVADDPGNQLATEALSDLDSDFREVVFPMLSK